MTSAPYTLGNRSEMTWEHCQHDHCDVCGACKFQSTRPKVHVAPDGRRLVMCASCVPQEELS